MSPKLHPAQRKPSSSPSRKWVDLKLLPSWTTKRLLQPLVAWRKRKSSDTGPEPSLSERSRSTRRQPPTSSLVLHSTALWDPSVEESTPTSDSRAKLWLLFKSQLKPIWQVSLKTPTSVPSTPIESPSWRKTWILQEESEETNFAITLIRFQRPEMRLFMNSHTSIVRREWKISKMPMVSELKIQHFENKSYFLPEFDFKNSLKFCKIRNSAIKNKFCFYYFIYLF